MPPSPQVKCEKPRACTFPNCPCDKIEPARVSLRKIDVYRPAEGPPITKADIWKPLAVPLPPLSEGISTPRGMQVAGGISRLAR
jgi:hypothetical protein